MIRRECEIEHLEKLLDKIPYKVWIKNTKGIYINEYIIKNRVI